MDQGNKHMNPWLPSSDVSLDFVEDIDDLYDALWHHSNSILQGLPLITEPNPYYFPFVAQLMRQRRDLVSCEQSLIKSVGSSLTVEWGGYICYFNELSPTELRGLQVIKF